MKTLSKKQNYVLTNLAGEQQEITTKELLAKTIQARMMLFLEHIGKLEQFKAKMV
ncbi:MAG: hypothetical protein FWG85_06550 [Bacteroidetes bacterium]|nr:hypothetical protein [Bacteroidota bacterium]